MVSGCGGGSGGGGGGLPVGMARPPLFMISPTRPVSLPCLGGRGGWDGWGKAGSGAVRYGSGGGIGRAERAVGCGERSGEH